MMSGFCMGSARARYFNFVAPAVTFDAQVLTRPNKQRKMPQNKAVFL